MSVEAISWALNLDPVPADRGGQPSSASKFVLVGQSPATAPGARLWHWPSGSRLPDCRRRPASGRPVAVAR